MKKRILIVLSLLSLIGCDRTIDIAIRSNDKNIILKAAEIYESQRQYDKALTLYEQATKFVIGTDEAPEITFRSAKLNHLVENYKLAAHQFKSFALSYPKDKRVEEASYMSAYCYYLDSPNYNLDQTTTYNAITELQKYINYYPNSSRIPECNKMIVNLVEKLEKKAFENAKTLYKITEYKGAVTSFNRVLDDFPDTKYREETTVYILRSKTELAVNSIHSLQLERINDATQTYKELTNKYPNSKFIDEANKLNNKLTQAKTNYEKVEETILTNKNKNIDRKKID